MRTRPGLPLAVVMLVLSGCPTGDGDDDSAEDPAGDPYAMLASHDGYWVMEIDDPSLPVPMTAINDVFIDPVTHRSTVYAQALILDQIASPPQVGPGECTEDLTGGTVCFHPNAVYLNGSGEELDAGDGTGEWWVKHSWIVDGEGYENCTLMPPKELYDDCFWVEGVLMEDGVSIQIGGVDEEKQSNYNVRRPLLDQAPVTYWIGSYAPANDDPEAGEIDLTPTLQAELSFHCIEETSAFDGQVRPCPETREASSDD